MSEDSQASTNNSMDEEINRGESQNVFGCRNCGSIDVEEGYSMNLCKDCRDTFAKRPFPVKIKLFLALLAVIIIYSLFNFPSTIKVGVEYERGIKAEKQLKYVTAAKCYENVLAVYPDCEKVLIKLYNVHFQNEDVSKADKVFEKISGKNGQKKKYDKETVSELNKVTKKLDLYYDLPSTLYDKLKGMKNASNEQMVSAIKPYVNKNMNEPYAALYLANLYCDMDKFNESLSILNSLTTKYPDYYSAYILKSVVSREIGKYDDAVACCRQVLKHNVEDIDAYVELSKIELKRKNNAKGLEYAQTAYKLDSENVDCISNLSLAYHYNNKIKERDDMLNLYKKKQAKDTYTINFLTKVFNGDLKWQK